MGNKERKGFDVLPWSVSALEGKDEDMPAAIPSKTVMDDLQRRGHTLTDLEQAVVLSRSHEPWSDKHQHLTALCDQTSDESLKRHLEAMLARQRENLQVFSENTARGAMYRWAAVWHDDSESNGSPLWNAEAAWRELAAEISDDFGPYKEIRIDRFLLWENADTENRVISMLLDAEGRLLALRGTEDPEWDSYIAANYTDIPHPFQRGDLVCTVDRKRFGVVETAGKIYNPDAELRPELIPWSRNAEVFRISLFDEETGRFDSAAEIQPAELDEYEPSGSCGLHSRDGLLGYVGDMYRGDSCWLPEFSSFTDDYQKEAEIP